MSSMIKSLLVAATAVAIPMLSATSVAAEGEKYILVSHAPDSDSWWSAS